MLYVKHAAFSTLRMCNFYQEERERSTNERINVKPVLDDSKEAGNAHNFMFIIRLRGISIATYLK